MSATAPIKYQEKWYTPKTCDNCARAGANKLIFFVQTDKIKPDGKPIWELHNPDTTLHEHVPGAAKSGGGWRGGNSVPPPEVTDIHLQPLMVDGNATEGLEVNNANISAMLQAGWKICMNRQTHLPYIERDAEAGTLLLVMMKVKASAV